MKKQEFGYEKDWIGKPINRSYTTKDTSCLLNCVKLLGDVRVDKDHIKAELRKIDCYDLKGVPPRNFHCDSHVSSEYNKLGSLEFFEKEGQELFKLNEEAKILRSKWKYKVEETPEYSDLNRRYSLDEWRGTIENYDYISGVRNRQIERDDVKYPIPEGCWEMSGWFRKKGDLLKERWANFKPVKFERGEEPIVLPEIDKATLIKTYKEKLMSTTHLRKLLKVENYVERSDALKILVNYPPDVRTTLKEVYRLDRLDNKKKGVVPDGEWITKSYSKPKLSDYPKNDLNTIMPLRNRFEVLTIEGGKTIDPNLPTGPKKTKMIGDGCGDFHRIKVNSVTKSDTIPGPEDYNDAMIMLTSVDDIRKIFYNTDLYDQGIEKMSSTNVPKRRGQYYVTLLAKLIRLMRMRAYRKNIDKHIHKVRGCSVKYIAGNLSKIAKSDDFKKIKSDMLKIDVNVLKFDQIRLD